MDMLKGLNPQQCQAVTAPLGPVLVMAGPGSGKTRVLSHRIAYLVTKLGVAPQKIVGVTFTNKAAREMRARVDTLLESQPGVAPAISLGTFHSLAARMLRREAEKLPVNRSFVIFDEDDQRSLLRQTLKELNLDPTRVHPAQMSAAISAAKNELIEVQDFVATTYFGEITRRVYARYQQLLQLNNALDFDDLLLRAVRLLEEHESLRRTYRDRYAHILVDEFQDTNTAQYVLLRLLTGEKVDLFVVGDADQSIYRWRGADYRNVQRFQQDYPQAKVILLEQNYRSTQLILDAAMAVIDRLPGRHKKKLFTKRGQGNRLVMHEAYDETDEARYVVDQIASLTYSGEAEPGECAVMYRTNAQSRALEEAFLKAGLPYKLVGAQRFYGRREVKDVIAYLRLIHNPADQVSLLRILNSPPRGLGAKSIEGLLNAAQDTGVAPGELILQLAQDEGAKVAQSLGQRLSSVLGKFGVMLRGWREDKDSLSLAGLMDRVLREVDYRGYIDDGTEEGQDRWANVMELVGVGQELPDLDLTTFLEHVALVSDQDTLTEGQNAPVLLTLHAAKGLEFRVVFIVGLDDGVLPHQRSFDDPEAMAEERRLFYVGITRSKDLLFLVRAFRRRLAGSSGASDPSRFLFDLPADVVQGEMLSPDGEERALYERQTKWERQSSAPLEARFQVGMRVKHATFGKGVVMASTVQRDDEEVTVAFQKVGIKRLAASLAKLKVLDD